MFEDNIFTENFAGLHGGAFFSENGSPVIRNCEFRKNLAGEGAAAYFIGESDPVMVGCRIEMNTAAGMGGGVVADLFASLTIRDCSFDRNTAASGGAVAFAAAPGVMEDCWVTDNFATFGGGMAIMSAERVEINRVVCERNEAEMYGGAIYSSDAVFRIEGGTIADSQAGMAGGGCWFMTSDAVIAGTSIVRNASVGATGGIALDTTTLSITGGEIWGNDVAISVSGDPVETVDARGNWWGDDTGPYHPTLNPGGLGDIVADSVLFDPWIVSSGEEEHLSRLSLESIFPNPAAASTTVAFSVPFETRGSVRVFDAAGRHVATLADGTLQAGPQSLRWDGRDSRGVPASQGVYFVRIEAGGAWDVGRIALVR